MHYVISSTWGPSDPTRAALPFIFAATALEAGDRVTLMLFHDAVTVAVKGSHPRIVPCGPAPRFAEVFAHPEATILVCQPCAEARGIGADMLEPPAQFAGMGAFHRLAGAPDTRTIAF